jgi:hypothetical protein
VFTPVQVEVGQRVALVYVGAVGDVDALETVGFVS